MAGETAHRRCCHCGEGSVTYTDSSPVCTLDLAWASRGAVRYIPRTPVRRVGHTSASWPAFGRLSSSGKGPTQGMCTGARALHSSRTGSGPCRRRSPPNISGAGSCISSGRHPLRYRGECLVWLLRRSRAGWRRGLCAGRHLNRAHSVAGTLCQPLLRRPQTEPPVHDRQPIRLRSLRRSPGQPWRLSRAPRPYGFFQMNGDGQSASLRLLFPHDGTRENSAPTRSSVGPSADRSSKVLRYDAEGRYEHISSVCGERR
jgi:hypothetical protein